MCGASLVAVGAYLRFFTGKGCADRIKKSGFVSMVGIFVVILSGVVSVVTDTEIRKDKVSHRFIAMGLHLTVPLVICMDAVTSFSDHHARMMQDLS
jgi:hypothetical protein